jgi:hypothetical protein
MERKYHLVSIHMKTGAKTYMTKFPMSHKEICTIKSRCTEYPFRRLQLEEVI